MRFWGWLILIVIVAGGIWWLSDNAGSINNNTGTGNYVDVSPAEAKDLIDNKADLVVLDVSNAYADGHMPSAINYYVGDGSLDDAIPSLDKNVPYLVYCHVDSASISGATKLIEAGFGEVYRLEGNYAAWTAAGYDIEK